MDFTGQEITMNKKVKEYILMAAALILLRLIYVLITKKPYFQGIFISTFIGILLGMFIFDTIALKINKKRRYCISIKIC